MSPNFIIDKKKENMENVFLCVCVYATNNVLFVCVYNIQYVKFQWCFKKCCNPGTHPSLKMISRLMDYMGGEYLLGTIDAADIYW